MNEKRKLGRPTLPEEQKMMNYTIRIRKDQRDKLTILGGMKWMRTQIDKAKLK